MGKMELIEAYALVIEDVERMRTRRQELAADAEAHNHRFPSRANAERAKTCWREFNVIATASVQLRKRRSALLNEVAQVESH